MSTLFRSCLALTLCGILSLSAPSARAASTEPTYTPVSTKADLERIRQNPSGHYRLTADIAFTHEDFAPGGLFYNEGAGWQPIGPDYAGRFTGELDGNGYTISGLTINIRAEGGSVYAGLFGHAGGTIRRLVLADTSVTVTGGQYVYAGTIAGAGTGSILSCVAENSRVAVQQAAVTGKVGGIAGRMIGGRMASCYAQGRVSAAGLSIAAGGITGQSRAALEGCVSRVSVDAQGGGDSYAGGIAGINESDIRACLSAEEYRLTSAMDGSIGGITGWNQGTVSASLAVGTLRRQIAHYEYVGGVCGLNDGTLSADYYALSGCADSTVFSGVKGLTDTELESSASYSGWDFERAWCQGLWSGLAVPTPQGAAAAYLRLQIRRDLSGAVDGLLYTPASLETYRRAAAQAAGLAENADAAECARVWNALRGAYRQLTVKRLAVTTQGSGQVSVTGDNRPGSTVRLTAKPAAGALFSGYCIQGLFTTDPIRNLTVSGSESAAAYFRPANACTVVFRGKYGRVIDVQTVSAASELKAPAAPALTGYRFAGWNTDLKQLDLSSGCVSVDAVYIVDDSAPRYRVTLIDATADRAVDAPLPFDSRVVLTPAAKPGQTFSHWLVNGVYAGAEESYTLYVAGSDTVKAVYGAASSPSASVSLEEPHLTKMPSGRYTLSVVAQAFSPIGATVVEYGVLFGADSRCTSQPETFTLGTLSYETQAVAASSSQPGRRYLIHLREIPAGRMRYARAYMIVRETGGKLRAVYSPVSAVTIPE